MGPKTDQQTFQEIADAARAAADQCSDPSWRDYGNDLADAAQANADAAAEGEAGPGE